jgi:hypothetical protein
LVKYIEKFYKTKKLKGQLIAPPEQLNNTISQALLMSDEHDEDYQEQADVVSFLL